MRIIGGKFGGLALQTPAGPVTRPITDRAKQSLFDALSAAVDLQGAAVLDCFAGPGSMGLECLSRGAGHALFVERDRAALAALRKNIASCNVDSNSTILPVDAYRLTGAALCGAGPLRLAFVDPPYAHMQGGGQRAKLDAFIARLAAEALTPDGLIILRHAATAAVHPAAMQARLLREMRYGQMVIAWLAPEHGTGGQAAGTGRGGTMH